ncbi:helix-turn-helix domain-containing protein [Streptomyces sp. NPDC088253]|uniref:helix-turn-helix domain-containing protein n=1 Tax=Streptomyces sp. NPDC088253 TaxID=3365846 RepID=UPI00382C61F0
MNDDSVATQCACRLRLEHLRDMLHELAQQAGLSRSELAAAANESLVKVRRWFREPDARSVEVVVALAQACVRRLHDRGEPVPSHLAEPHWWRDQLNTVNIHALFGICCAERVAAPAYARLMTRTLRPFVRHVPVLTSMMAVMLFAYVLLVATGGPELPVRRAPSAASSAEASEQANDARRDPPAPDRGQRGSLDSASDAPFSPYPGRGAGGDWAVFCRAVLFARGDGIAILVLCPEQGLILVCSVAATSVELPRRRSSEAGIPPACSVTG